MASGTTMGSLRRTSCLVLLCTAVASAQMFTTPAGAHVLVNLTTELPIASELFEFNESLGYGIQAPDASTTACSFASTRLIRCAVTAPGGGDLLYKLYEAAAGASRVLDAFLVRAYQQPSVRSVSPTALPLAGGARLTLQLIGGGGGRPAARSFQTKVHFYRPCCSFNASCCQLLGEAAMQPVDAGYSTISGRSPAFTVSGEQLEVYLALNGRNFVATGQLVNVSAIAKLKVAFLYVGTPTDFGWTFQHNVARLEVDRMFYGQVETTTAEAVNAWGPNECDFCAGEPDWDNYTKKWTTEPAGFFPNHRVATIIRKWVEEDGVGMVFGTSFYFQWDMYHMALRYPGVHFVHASGWLTRRNMAVVFPKVYQARYLSGIALAWYIKKHNLPKRVGHVSAYKIGETDRALNALKLGMEQVDPEIDIYLIYTKTWFDGRRESIAAKRLLQFYDVEGITQHTDSRAAQVEANLAGKVGLGYNSDMLLTVGDSVLTSPILSWGAHYSRFVQQVIDGKDPFEANLWQGFEIGATRLSSFSPKVPVEAMRHIREEMEKLTRGEDVIFCKPGMRDNRGRLRNGPTNPSVSPLPGEVAHLKPGTACLTDAVVNQVCQEYAGFSCKEHWLLEGIHDTCAPSPRMPRGIQSPKLPNGTCLLGVLDLPDSCPPGELLQVIGCTKARVGHFAYEEKEISCSAGYFSHAEGMTSCSPCLPGSFSNSTGATECTVCAAGT